jgi:aspartate dehydrogenase
MDIGIVGIGAIGATVAKELDRDKVPGAKLTALTSRNQEKARLFAATLSSPPKVVELSKLPSLCELIIEASGAATLGAVAEAGLNAGVSVMVLSCGVLLERPDLISLAKSNGAHIYVPSGAIIGLDGLKAASMGHVDSVIMTTRKPPKGLEGAPGVTTLGIDISTLVEPTTLFEGPVVEAVKLFPANVNVAAAVSMAGIGPLRTIIKIIADPRITRNTHVVTVEGEFGRMEFSIENIPTEANPRTGRLTALSVLACIRQIISPLQVGV